MKKTLLILTTAFVSLISFAQVPNYVPTNGLVGYWPFNGNANDESGNGNNGTVNGATLTTDRFGVPNRAYSFDGSTNYILTNYQGILGSNARTVSFWAKTSSSAFMSAVAWGGTGSGINMGNGFSCGYNFSSLGLTIGGSDCAITYSGNAPVNDNIWHYYTFTMSNSSQLSGIQVYQDGNLITTIIQTYNPNVLLNTITGFNVCFGRIIYSGGNNLFYNGILDDIGIWNRALTQQEITNLYTNSVPPTLAISPSNTTICAGDSITLTASTSASNISACASSDMGGTLQNGLVGYWPFCGNANDASGNGNNGTVNGATLTTDRFGNANSAYYFNGSNARIVVPDANSLDIQSNQSLTLSSWVKHDISVSNIGVYMVSKYSGVIATGPQYGIGTGFTGQGYTTTQIASGLSNHVELRGDNVINDGNWHLMTYVWENGLSAKLYVDGILDTTKSMSLNGSVINTLNLHFGCGANLAQYYKGSLDDISIYNRALNLSEIQQLYTQGQTTYSWSNGATTPSITVAPTTNTAFSCTATVNGASVSSTVMVTVNTLPTVNAGVDLSVCIGNTATLAASGANTYSWNNGATNAIAFTPASTATYTVTGTNTATGCTNTDQVVVTVNALPTVNAGVDQTVCAGTSVSLAGTGATTYSWNNGVSNGIAFTPASTTTYTVTGTNTTTGCTNTDQVVVTVNTLPTVNAGSDQELCQGQSTTLFGTGATTYSWNNNVQNGVGFVPTVTQEYVLTGTNSVNGCSNSDTVSVTVNSLPNVNAGPDFTICEGDTIILSGSGALNYTWNNNVIDGQEFVPSSTLTYQVTGTDMNNCSNSDEATITVNQTSASTLNETALDSYTLNGQTYTQSGTYTQVIPNAVGCDSTITLNLTLNFTGINELTNSISIAPNPATDQLTISCSSSLDENYILFDPQGRAVLSGKLSGTTTQLDLSKLARGNYLLQIGEKKTPVKLVKE